MNPEILTELFRRALAQELGVFIDCNNPQRVASLLHGIKRNNPDFASIEITVPETTDTVLLVKKTVELQEPLDQIYTEDLPDV